MAVKDKPCNTCVKWYCCCTERKKKHKHDNHMHYNGDLSVIGKWNNKISQSLGYLDSNDEEYEGSVRQSAYDGYYWTF